MSERVTAIKTSMDATLVTNPDINIWPTVETVYDVKGFTDLVKDVTGDTITLDAHEDLVVNSLAGFNVTGLSEDNAGDSWIILSNTAADPTVITLTTTPPADLDEDTIEIHCNYKVLLYETNQNRSDGLYKYYGFGCHIKANSAANLDNLMEDILRFDSRSIHTDIRHSGTTLLQVLVTSFYPMIESDKFEGHLTLEGKWII